MISSSTPTCSKVGEPLEISRGRSTESRRGEPSVTRQEIGTVEPKIDREYKDILPPYQESEYEALKHSIREDGQLEPIIISKDGRLLDGHTRLRICQELRVAPLFLVRSFSSRLEERKFVITINLRRRQLNDFQRIEVSQMLLETEKQLAKDRPTPQSMKLYLGDFEEVCRSRVTRESIDLIVTDPPYTISEFPLEKWEALAVVAKRSLKPGAFFVTYSGQEHLPEITERLSHHLTWFWQFGNFHSSNETMIHDKKIRNRFKPILIYTNSQRGARPFEH